MAVLKQTASAGTLSDPIKLDRVLHAIGQSLTDYVGDYNTARPHRGIDLDVPVPAVGNAGPRTETIGRIERVDVLGGLLHEYRHAA
jgi:hypothetical protein